jgi:hypothetical protein
VFDARVGATAVEVSNVAGATGWSGGSGIFATGIDPNPADFTWSVGRTGGATASGSAIAGLPLSVGTGTGAGGNAMEDETGRLRTGRCKGRVGTNSFGARFGSG